MAGAFTFEGSCCGRAELYIGYRQGIRANVGEVKPCNLCDARPNVQMQGNQPSNVIISRTAFSSQSGAFVVFDRGPACGVFPQSGNGQLFPDVGNLQLLLGNGLPEGGAYWRH